MHLSGKNTGLPASRPKPPPPPKNDGPDRKQGTAAPGQSRGRPAGRDADPGGQSWGERFARERTTAMTLLAEPSPLDTLETDRPPAPVSPGSDPLPGGNLPRTSLENVLGYVPAAPGGTPPTDGTTARDGDAPAGTDAVLEGRGDEETESILADVETLQSGTPQERLQAVFSLAESLRPEEIEQLTAELEIDDRAVVELLSDADALGAAATLASSEASDADKLAAAVTLTESVGALADGRLEEVLAGPLAAIASGPELIAAIETFLDPEASPLEKADAALAFAVAAKDSLGELSPALARSLRNLDSLGTSISAALTLLDTSLPPAERLAAAGELFAEVPDILDDLGNLNRRLIDRLLGEHADIAFDLPEELASNLDPAVRSALTPEQLFRLNAIDEELLAEGSEQILFELLATTEEAASIDHLLDALEAQPDTASRRALVETLQGLDSRRLDEFLAGTIDGRPAAIALAETVGRLDPESQAAFRTLVKNFDPRAIDFLVRTIDLADPALVQDVLRHADQVDSQQVGQVLGLIAAGLDRAGIELSADIVAKLFRGLGKIIPGLGAVAAGHAAFEHGQILFGDYPPDIRYLASAGAKINAGDAALSIVEAFTAWTGVTVLGDIGIGAAGLLVDLLVADQVNQYEAAQAAGETYEPPEWLTTANVAAAASQGPTGWAEFWTIYGVDAGTEALGTAAGYGGELAIHAAEGLLTLGTEAVGDQLEMTADGLHLLADIIRNPEVYGERATEFAERSVERLSELADGVGEIARAAREELGDTVDHLKSLGADGLEALGWIASHPGEAAERAIEAIGDVAGDLLEAGGEALDQALETLEDIAERGAEAAAAVERAFEDVAERAFELGEAGIELLGEIARNPGPFARIAVETLADVVAEAGELAEAAVGELVELGEAGLELLGEAVDRLADLGEEGLETLRFIATQPDEAGRIALGKLEDLVIAGGELAERAGEKIVELVENGHEMAREVAAELIAEGAEAFQNVLVSLGDEIGEGIIEVLNALADVDDAAREALADLADAGFDFAREGLERAAERISDLGSWVWNQSLPGRIWNHFND